MTMTKTVLKSYAIVLLLLVIASMCYCCKPSNNNGFELEEFIIDNLELQSVADSVVKMYSPVLQSTEKKRILSLNLSQKDSVLLFIFSIQNEHELINRYIYRENKRIVGYTTSGNTNIILLSDIDNLPELGKLFGTFIHPVGQSKVFSYMKYPSNLYIGDGVNAWPDFDLVYDPTYIVYPFKNNRFLQPFMTTNPDFATVENCERDKS